MHALTVARGHKCASPRRILLLPSKFYDDEDDRHFRIGFGREGLPAALAALDAYLVAHPGL